ncbi:cytochrome P450 [Xylaria sp. FL1042]|nr:cytochrome P450 [Xylaria sp. FL1042]
MAVRGIYHIVYNIFFYLLSKYLGPKLAAWTNAAYLRWFLSGRQLFIYLRLYEKYGLVLFKDIYGIRQGYKPFIKGDFYAGGTFAARGGVFDLLKGYEKMAFDIIGDLAFGEKFGALDLDTTYLWIATLFGALTKGAMADTFKRRINIKTSRKDFMTRILEYRDEAAYFWGLVAGGSEITLTALLCVTFYFLRHLDIGERLKSEVCGVFTSPSEIDEASTKDLRYLIAICLEAMRIYFLLPRTTWLLALTAVILRIFLTFKPERWLDSAANESDIFEASQPFLLGARGCIGKSLGWMEMRITLAKLFLTLIWS